VRDEAESLLGVLPLYQRPDDVRRGLLRSLGDGKACTDYVSIIAPNDTEADVESRHLVARMVADHLVDTSEDTRYGWHTLLMDGVVEGDPTMDAFRQRLAERSASVHATSRMHTWYRACAESWDEYLKQFSRSSRSKQKRFLKRLDQTTGLKLESPTEPSSVAILVDQLVELHQQRWTQVGETGTFHDDNVRHFIQEVAARALEKDNLWLVALKLDGQLMSAALSLIGDDRRAYCYCTATDLSEEKLQPGNLLTMWMIQEAHRRKLQGIDFLRGDEEYKRRLHAEPKKQMEWRIASPHLSSRLKHAAWLTGFEAKQWIRRSVGRKAIDVVLPA